MADFVLVHGAWHGGWCWSAVAGRLRAAGHAVWTPTLTGLGERAHLLSADIDLELHVTDILAMLEMEDLREVVLCGHSYGGMVITGVADRAPDRIAHLVYLDAFVPNDGEALIDLLPAERRAAFEQKVRDEGDGWRLPPVPASVFGITDPETAARVDRLCGDQPVATFTTPLRRPDTAAADRLARTYILAEAYRPSAFHRYAAAFADDPAWRTRALPTGHDAMLTMPDELAALLQETLA